MPKPIFVITFLLPKFVSKEFFDNTEESLKELSEHLKEDYYVLHSFSDSITETQYNLYSVNNIDDVTFEELKEIVKAKIRL